jgi:hypothetical protein
MGKPSAGAGVPLVLSFLYSLCILCMYDIVPDIYCAMYGAEGMQGGCQCDAQRAASSRAIRGRWGAIRWVLVVGGVCANLCSAPSVICIGANG